MALCAKRSDGMEVKMNIRKAEKEDIKDIQDLRYLLAKYDKSLGLDIAVTEWGYTEVGKKDLEYFLNEQYIYVAEENEKIVGFITAEIFKKKAWYTVRRRRGGRRCARHSRKEDRMLSFVPVTVEEARRLSRYFCGRAYIPFALIIIIKERQCHICVFTNI